MAEMDKISESILSKVKDEAEDIINEAKKKAQAEIVAADNKYSSMIESRKNQLLIEARSEANRIMARSSIKSKQELLTIKAGIIAELTERVKKLLVANSKKTGMNGLIKETMKLIQSKKMVIYVSARDIPAVKKLVDSDKELSGRIIEIKECECTGGLIAEDTEGKVRIDNTYETRLAMLLPRIIPDISKELFGNS